MKLPKSKVQTLDERTWQGSQSWNFEGVYRLIGSPHKLRVSIKRDSYNAQSHARIEIWSQAELKWNFVRALPWEQTTTFGTFAYQNSAPTAEFATDTQELLELAADIVL